MNRKVTLPECWESPNGKIPSQSSKTRTPRVIRGKRKALETVEQNSGILERITQLAESTDARELQIRAYTALLESLRRGENSGIFKLPTGTGKTRIFANILKAFEKNGLILVPRTDLYTSTARELSEVGFDMSTIHFVHEEDGTNTEERMMSLLTNPSIDWSSGKNVCIMTYQALTQMVRKNTEMGDFMRSHFDIVIEDEAHRGIGDRTKKAVGGLTENENPDMHNSDSVDTQENGEEEGVESIEQVASEIQDELEAEKILALRSNGKMVEGGRYNYKFTATPDLIGKSVSDESEYIMYATVEDGIRTGAIVLPQYLGMGEAFIRDRDVEKWKVGDIEKMAEHDEFVDSEGLSIRDKIISAYLEKKGKHGSLPGVAFASTINHAKQIVDIMKARGIRAERVTSAYGDISSERATEMMDRGELDVIVTVTKVSEGFDYPPLACAMWFSPVISNAKILQGNGRIMRTTDEKGVTLPSDTNGRLVASESTYIIAPSVWYGGSVGGNPSDSNIGTKGEIGGGEENRETRRRLPRVGNFYELLMRQGELDINSLPQEMRDMIQVDDSIVCELGEEVTIDGVVYVGISTMPGFRYSGMLGKTILKNLAKSSMSNLRARQGNGFHISLIPLDFINAMKVEYNCEPGEQIEVNNVVYVGVLNTITIAGLRGETLLKNFHKQNPDAKSLLQAITSKGVRMRLIPLDFINAMKVEYNCEPGEQIEVNNVVYVGVTNYYISSTGIGGQTILKRWNDEKENKKLVARTTKGRNIALIPSSFIMNLKKKGQ